MFVFQHFSSGIQKELEFNDKLSVIQRALHTEAMNESPIPHTSLCVCVCVCVRLQESIWRTAVPNWLSTLGLWRDPLRYDYWLPRPHSEAGWSETTHAAYRTEALQVSLNGFQGLASKGSFDGKCREQVNRVARRGEDKMREPHTVSVGVWHWSL